MQRFGKLLIYSHDFNEFWVKSASETGLKTLGIHPVPGISSEGPRSLEQLLKRRERTLSDIYAGTLREECVGIELEAHAMHVLLPRSLFERFPLWFREDEHGARTPVFNCCPSSDGALAEIEKNAQKLGERIAEFSHTHRYYLWTDDGGEYCHCEKCKDLSPSDQAMLIANSIYRGLRRADPLAQLSFLAYQATIAPPQRVAPESGIFLEYAPIDRKSSFCLNDATCKENAAQARNILPLLEYFGKRGSQALDYWLDVSYFYRWQQPFGELPLHSGVLQRDVLFYEECGFEQIASFACGINEDYVRRYGDLPLRVFSEVLGRGR